MKKFLSLRVLALVSAAFFLVACQSAPPAPPVADGSFGGKRVAAYFSSSNVYAKRDYQVSDIPAANLTHIFYAFMKIDPATKAIDFYDKNADIVKKVGDEPADLGYRGSFAQLYMLKQKNPDLKLIASVGGGTQSDQFSEMAASAATRKAFADSVAVFLKKYHFDGVDLDWEFPVAGGEGKVPHSPNDKHNLTLLIEALRKTLDAAGVTDGIKYEVGLTVTQNPGYAKNLEISALGKVVDFMNVMSYDYAGVNDPVTDHLAPLYANRSGRKLNVSATIQYYLDNGMPASKLSMGIPLYGVAWQVPVGSKLGMFTKTVERAAVSKTLKTGILDYAAVQQLVSKGIRPLWDEQSHASYLYDTETGLVVTYDDNRSILEKVDFALAKNLGGVMFWELSQDRGGDLLNLAAWTLKRQAPKPVVAPPAK